MAIEMLTRLKGSYGLGIEVDEVEGMASFSHGGSNMGFQTMLYALTKAGQGAVVMTNGDGGHALAGDILRSIAAEYNWKEWRVIEKPVAQVSAGTLAHYTGSYQLGPMKITVTQKGDRLFIAAPPLGAAPREIFASSKTAFFNLHDGMEFDFESNQSGKFDLIIKAEQRRKATRIL